jgi:hypothetical protein
MDVLEKRVSFMSSLQDKYDKSSYFSEKFLKNVISARKISTEMGHVIERASMAIIGDVEEDDDDE